jgi:hypothetical protein
VIKNTINRFRVNSDRINYLLLEVKKTHQKKFDTFHCGKLTEKRRNMWSDVELVVVK